MGAVEPTSCGNQWHATFSFTLNEAIDSGMVSVDGTDEFSLLSGWEHYSEEQAQRVVSLIVGTFGFMEIGITPIRIFMQRYAAEMNLTAQYANQLYAVLSDYDPMQDSHIKRRYRDIDSSFPQTMLNPDNGDYASYGKQGTWEELHEANTLDTVERIKTIKSIDSLFLDAIETFFIHTFIPVVNGY